MEIEKYCQKLEAKAKTAYTQIFTDLTAECYQIRNSLGLICTICRQNLLSMAIIPCGHIFCRQCCEKIISNRCPVCDVEIGEYLQLYFP